MSERRRFAWTLLTPWAAIHRGGLDSTHAPWPGLCYRDSGLSLGPRSRTLLGPVSPWVLFHLLGMADRDRLRVLTDAQREVLAPLIEACRPPHKTDHHDLRRIPPVTTAFRRGAEAAF